MKPAYLAGFRRLFFAAGLCGAGCVLSIRRNTSSGLEEKRWGRLSGLLMEGV